MNRAVKIVRMPDGSVYVVYPENPAEWGAWVQRVLADGKTYAAAPEGPRMQDPGDPPQDGCKFCSDGCVLCQPDEAA